MNCLLSTATDLEALGVEMGCAPHLTLLEVLCYFWKNTRNRQWKGIVFV